MDINNPKYQSTRMWTPNAHDGYCWMPASATYNPYGGFGIYIKYAKSKHQHHIKIKEMSSQRVHLVCPDREIYMTASMQHDDTWYPHGFDEYLDFNILHDPAAHAMGLKYVMPNFVHCQGKNASAENRVHGRGKSELTILSDSGGFQFSTGVVDSINPQQLMEWYGRNVDAGMVLDVPLTVSDDKLIVKCGNVQARNNKILMGLKPDHVELVNIFHGINLKDITKYREIVERPDINRVAVAGMYRYELVTMCDYLYELTRTGQRYSQYHLLGFSSVTRIPLIVALANKGQFPPHITSDSTTHIQTASNRQYMTQTHNLGRRLNIGISEGLVPNTGSHLPCHCPVCKAIKYRDIMSFMPSHIVKQAMSYHNMYEMNRLINSLQEAIKNLKHHEYVDYIVKNLRATKGEFVQQLKPALDYIHVASEEGQTKARKKFKSLLGLNFTRYSDDTNVGLFGSKEGKTHSSEIQRLNSIADRLDKQASDFESGKAMTLTKRKTGQKSQRLTTLLT